MPSYLSNGVLGLPSISTARCSRVAINADDSEVDEEGPYWLALLKGAPFVLDEDLMHNGQQYYKGWVVVLGQWYKLRQRSERGYELCYKRRNATSHLT